MAGIPIETKARRLYRASIAVLAAGLIVGLGSLLAPLGIWLGLWEWRTGLQILGALLPVSGPVAVTCLVLAVGLGILARIWATGNLAPVVAVAAAGAVSAGIAWYIPGSFQAPEGQSYPSIHDISTDTDNPPEFIAVVPLREKSGATNTVEYGRSPDMTPQRLAELQRQAYPDIKPVTLNVSPDRAYDRVLARVDEMGWELVDADRKTGHVEATDTTFWFRFKDDIAIRIRAEGNGSRIDARSVSRVGRGDAGTNAKRLREFFAGL